jgi:hypothetical protein
MESDGGCTVAQMIDSVMGINSCIYSTHLVEASCGFSAGRISHGKAGDERVG